MNPKSSVKQTQMLLKTVRTLHVSCLLTVPIEAIGLFVALEKGFVPPFDGRDARLLLVGSMLSFFSLLCLAVSLLVPRLARWQTKHKGATSILLTHLLVRLTLFEASVIVTFIMGFLGASWLVLGPLFVLEGTALVLTLPTETRLARWQGKR